jgi:predicted nucleic acid-binding protein
VIVLDTNVLSELLRPNPEQAVLSWMDGKPGSAMFVTAIARAEMFLGIRSMPEGRRRSHLEWAAREIFEIDFFGRVLNFDRDAADAFATLAAERRRAGRPMSQADAMIAAIVLSRGAALATRNVRDFVDCGITVINPWG